MVLKKRDMENKVILLIFDKLRSAIQKGQLDGLVLDCVSKRQRY